jgi:hypothetical protein
MASRYSRTVTLRLREGRNDVARAFRCKFLAFSLRVELFSTVRVKSKA